MLRVEFNHDGNGTLIVRLQGRLVGPYAEDARVTLTRYQVPTSVLVDVSELFYVDPLGEQVLLWLGRLGARFVAVNVYTRALCERLHLPVAETRAGISSADTQVLA